MAFKAALKEWHRNRVPLYWAMAQDNLGATLGALYLAESDTIYLEEAATAFRAAIEERTVEQVPIDWALSTGNLGMALSELAKRSSSLATALQGLDNIAAAEALLRKSGHRQADFYARMLPAAKALVATLTRT